MKAERTRMADTTYIVLHLDGDGAWRSYDDVKASSPAAAIRIAVNEAPPLVATTYVAVPARSWKPVTVTTETRTVLKLEQPTAD
jgi:hypothetical protein